MKCLLFVIIKIFSTHFCNQPVLFAQLEKVSKLWNNNRTVHARKKLKQKQNQRRQNRSIVQCSPSKNATVSLKNGLTV